jgi:prephenate dehydrogenase
MWRDILVANKEDLLDQSRIFQNTLKDLEKLIGAADGDALEERIDQASHTRANWRISSPKSLK